MTVKIITNENEPKRFMLVGVGPHAKRIYIPHLNELRKEGRAKLVCAVDVQANEQEVTAYRDKAFPDAELAFVPFFTNVMPSLVSEQLKELARRLRVTCVIISTEPLAHKVYGLWAMEQQLNVIMDKPITTQKGVTTSIEQAIKIGTDYDDLLEAYTELQRHQTTFFLITSHRRYHPGLYCTFDMIKEITDKSNCPVTNIISTHCDGMWRLPTEMVDQRYHSFNSGYGKVSHSGYHFLDMVYRFVKAGWTEEKKPDRIEVVSSFAMPAGFQKMFNHEDYKRTFGAEAYAKACKYSDKQLETLMVPYGEIDAALQIAFIKDDEPICLAQVNLQHNGFSRRSWIQPGPDLYKGVGRVKHEFHEIKSGPFQTIVIDSRQANDKHDRSKPSTAKIGTDNHFEVHTFRNSDLLDEDEPLKTYSVQDLDRRYDSKLPGIYSENVKRGILWEAVDYLEGNIGLEQMVSNLDDHSVPAHLMSAVYISHVRRKQGLNPVVSIDLNYPTIVSSNHGCAVASIRENSKAFPLSWSPETATPATTATANSTASSTAAPTTTSKVQNIHIHIPLNQGEIRSDEIHVHLNLNGSDTRMHEAQNTVATENVVLNGQSDDRTKLLNCQQVNGHQVNGQQINGHPQPTATLPSWSKGAINGNGIRLVPAAASLSS